LVTKRRAAIASVGLLAALVALGVWGVNGPLSPVFNQPVRLAANGGVVEIDIQPIPEGPGVGLQRRPQNSAFQPLSKIERYIPNPLPPPLFQWNCTLGGDLVVSLGNGKQVTYGPCLRPKSIDRLWAEIIYVWTDGQCAPRCGP
jgi:hypothetical protein